MCQPTPNPHIDEIVDDGVAYKDPDDKCRVFRKHLWGETDDEHPTPIPEPQEDPNRTSHFASQRVRVKEVKRAIQELKTGKAAGIDGIPNDLLKLAQNVISGHLQHLFQASINLSYEPDQFKWAKTVMIRKQEKESYKEPGSWRPIALLSTIGKLLESIVARRLSDLALEHGLLSPIQYGVAGRCTTKALRHLLDPVYAGWLDGRKATMMSLDIKGAYNRIPGRKLLEVLINKGIPLWIVRFIWSYLSRRRTSFDMPGHRTRDPFFVNIGIPQGSTLSAILFAFFTAPLLNRLEKFTGQSTDKVALAYADDLCVLVTSKKGHTYNNGTLEGLHREIQVWAQEYGVQFEKYKIMHLRKVRDNEQCYDLPNIPGLSGQQPVTKMKVLGVMIDQQLRWNEHVKEVSPIIVGDHSMEMILTTSD